MKAKNGAIGGFLFENRNIKLPRTLFHNIEVPLDTAPYSGFNWASLAPGYQ